MATQQRKRIKSIFILYWVLLAYIIAALIWWFIALNNQNKKMAEYKLQELVPEQVNYTSIKENILAQQKRKTIQYIGEGLTFFLLIAAGAIFVFRAVRKQLRYNQEQQHFMMALTHELKTPIAVATLNLETLQKRKLDEFRQHTLIQKALQETNRLNTLCNNMLISSQIDAANYIVEEEEFNLSEILITTITEYKNRFTSFAFLQDVEENIFIKGDRMLIQIAINNLLDNAIKYSPKQSTITASLVTSNMALLKIKDEGKGIAEEDKKRIFEKFYRGGNTATKQAKGTGIGLYLTKNIVTKHKGNISMTDNTPNGSTFEVQLPIAQLHG
ncbi:MAG: HAMP domain-containing histidine kinase [Ferruginibacter sp.]|nr:HAMP domain-containing histidine kinase [Ferruginibacter sp.]